MAYTTIDNPELYFQTKAYTGTGSSHAVTLDGSEDMQPDWVWIKARSQARNHKLYDSVRGVTKTLGSNESDAEATVATSLTAFGSDGFTVSSDVSVNESSETFVAWNWKASGSSSSNTNGSITSSVSVNTTAGFSIVSWTGDNSGSATIGHGLGAIPDVVIIKNGTDATNWGVKHSSMTSGHMAVLNGTDPSSDRNGSTNGGIGNLTSSTTFGFIGGSAGVPEVNGSSDSMIAYCFTSIKGFSKHGSYTGNGSTDGVFIQTGFSVSWFMIKRTDSASSWRIWDNKRDPFNVRDTSLNANESGAEYTDASVHIDFLSNGVKFRNADDNVSGASYIFMAFAESPFVTSTGIPTTAR